MGRPGEAALRLLAGLSPQVMTAGRDRRSSRRPSSCGRQPRRPLGWTAPERDLVLDGRSSGPLLRPVTLGDIATLAVALPRFPARKAHEHSAFVDKRTVTAPVGATMAGRAGGPPSGRLNDDAGGGDAELSSPQERGAGPASVDVALTTSACCPRRTRAGRYVGHVGGTALDGGRQAVFCRTNTRSVRIAGHLWSTPAVGDADRPQSAGEHHPVLRVMLGRKRIARGVTESNGDRLRLGCQCCGPARLSVGVTAVLGFIPIAGRLDRYSHQPALIRALTDLATVPSVFTRFTCARSPAPRTYLDERHLHMARRAQSDRAWPVAV